MKLSQLGEFGLIELLKKFPAKRKDTLLGIGDDCALIGDLLVTTDTLVENVHFKLKKTSFYDLGYTVILPDQRGQGLSGGTRGDYTILECVQNIVDVAHWAEDRFQGPLFMAGGSVGGALTYYAAAAGTSARAIACLNLFNFENGIDGIQISRVAFLSRCNAIVKMLRIGNVLLKPIHRLRLPFHWIGAFDKLMDERDAEFQAQWDADPVPPRLVSLRSLASNMTTAPAIPFEKNQVPALVINQSLDKMVNPGVTRRNYEKLSGLKHYIEIPFGHWSNQPEFWKTIVESSDKWFRKYLPPGL